MTVAIAMTVGATSKAQADPVNDVSFGYQFLHVNDGGGNFPIGFYVDVSGDTSPKLPALKWVGDFGYGRHTESDFGQDFHINFVTVQGGVRYNFTEIMAPVTVGVQGTIGIGRSSTEGFSDTNTVFTGLVIIEYPLMNGWKARAAAGIAKETDQSSGGTAAVVRVGATKTLKK